MNNVTVANPDIYFNEMALKNVDKRSRLIVFGYIRNEQQNLFNIIPKNISLIILAFYVYFSDEFNPNLCGDGMKISNNNKIITGGKKWRTCYGKKMYIING